MHVHKVITCYTQWVVGLVPINRLKPCRNQSVQSPLAAEGGGSIPCGWSTRAGGDPEGAHVALALDVNASKSWLEAHVRRLHSRVHEYLFYNRPKHQLYQNNMIISFQVPSFPMVSIISRLQYQQHQPSCNHVRSHRPAP